MPNHRTMKGGRRRRGGNRKRVGGRTRRGGMSKSLSKLAVPAALLWANTMYRPGAIGKYARRDLGVTTRRRRKRRSSRRR